MHRNVLVCSFIVIVSGWCTLTSAENTEMSSAESKDVNDTCIDIGHCPTVVDTDCQEECGCDKRIPTTYDNKTDNCVINITLLIMSLTEKYNTEGKDMSTDDDVDDMASRLRAEADRIFKGVIVAAFFFIACASICTLTACIYCCRMNYTDYQLKKSIKVLARKMGQKSQLKKPVNKVPTAPIAESCNVVVEDAVGAVAWIVNMIEASLLDTVVITLGVLLTMTMLSCLCCICMKLSDLRMKSHILEMAKRKGIEVDLDKLDPKYVSQSPHSNENCTILIPDVAIVI